MALEFDKEDLIYIKETLEWLSEHTVIINDSRINCETEHSRTQNSLIAIKRGLSQCSDENAALPLKNVSIRYFAVGYVANVLNGRIIGLLDVTTNGKFLNRNLTIGNIKEKQPSAIDIVITTITEMSKEDFEAWVN